MTIESSFLGRLTSEGRLKYQWQQAMAERDVQIRLAKLRLIQEQLLTNQTKFVHVWLPFLNDFLSSTHIYMITEKDMQEVEEMGSILFHTSLEKNHRIAEEIWRLAVYSYTLRGEEVQVCALLARMFHSPSIKNEWRDWAAWQLAERGASDDNHLSIYMYCIQRSTMRTSSNPMLTILARVCCVNFDSDIAQLKRAKELSAYLVTSKIKITEKWKASGFYALLVEHTPLEAIQLFMQVITEGNDDIDVVCGVIAASIQSGHFEHLTKITHIAKKFTSPIITRLLKFADVLQWLDNQYESEYPPSTAQDIELLKDLELYKYLDDVIDVAAGRLYLLEGNGYKASEILHEVIARRPEQS